MNIFTHGSAAKKHSLLLLIIAVFLCVALIGSTVAYLIIRFGTIKNVFVPGKVSETITETFDGKIKQDVKIKNTGDATAYVRATVVFNWKNANGEILYTALAANTDYTITYDTSGAWIKGSDGYWYHKAPIAPDSESVAFIKECKPVDSAVPEGYMLSVDIISEAVQADPTDAVKAAWGVQVAQDGSLSFS